MRSLLGSLLLLGALVVLLTGADAGEKTGKVKLEGTITCAKCGLMKTDECMTVIVAKGKDNKDVIYYFDPTASKKYHGKVCSDPAPGIVEGTVKTEGDKKIVTPSKVTFDK